jgi:hypothetical protein
MLKACLTVTADGYAWLIRFTMCWLELCIRLSLISYYSSFRSSLPFYTP